MKALPGAAITFKPLGCGDVRILVHSLSPQFVSFLEGSSMQRLQSIMLRCSRRPRAHWGDCNPSSESDSTPHYHTEFLKGKQCCVLTQYHRYYWFVWLIIQGFILLSCVLKLHYSACFQQDSNHRNPHLTRGFHFQEWVRGQERKSVKVSQSTAT